MKLSEIVAKLEKRIPKSWAESWDNPGLSVAECDMDINRIAVALDATEETVALAASGGCCMLVTHHPLIFRPMRSVLYDSCAGRTVISAVKNSVALYSAHTNWDSSREGVNFALASLLGLEDIAPLIPSETGAWGMGAVGALPEAVDFRELSEMLAEKWGLSDFTLYGSGGSQVKRIALGGGACQEFWPAALSSGADCFITADVSYHNRLEALAAGLLLVRADHGEMERASLPALKTAVAEETGIDTILLKESRAPFLHGRAT